MTIIYVKEQGAKVQKRGERLIVSKQGQIVEEFPLQQVEQVVALGNVQFTTQTLTTLVQRGIDVVFASTYGKYKFRPDGGEGSKHVALRKQQLQIINEGRLSLPIAKSIVLAKIHNQRVILQRQTRRVASGGRGDTVYLRDRGRFDRALAGMMQMQKQSQQADTLNSLRGYEGKAAAFYFDAIRSLVDPAWGFKRREFYPPPDPFNALLSFTYSLILKDVRMAVQMVGLDVYMGFFHEVQPGRPSLALDLMEEWRPLIGDSLSLELINRRSLLPETFHQTRNPRRPIELGEDGVEIVLQAYGSRLMSRLFHPMAGPGGNTTLQQAIVLQVRRIARVILGKESSYEGIRAK